MVDRQDVAESWERLSPWVWRVHEDYRLEGEFIVNSGKTRLTYTPITRLELPAELAKVRSSAGAEIFVGRYGLLGFADAHRAWEIDGLDLVRSGDSWRRRAQERVRHIQAPGDPVEWILAHTSGPRSPALNASG